MRIAVAADHAGFELKRHLVACLAAAGHTVDDLGTDTPASTDYPDWAARVSEAVREGRAERGLLVCGTGVGMAMAANRRRGVRAVATSDLFTARLAREHNDANVLALGARIVAPALAEEIVTVFLATPFAGGRHQRRVGKLDDRTDSEESPA
ncbi:MAG: ribose 5-phosphate isomerase B [Thermoanaerobaculia bacterium]|nr:MAG: ribose 5-phosphate isomerase B [Thermoanaerobaculia bacterium]MBZ0102740.1 ribose 5-phosphate isomerase B [Thermoanaerobaculia bacterium]